MDIPGYRKAKAGEGDCDDCSYSRRTTKGLFGLHCTMYDANVNPEWRCPKFEARKTTRDSESTEQHR